MKKLLSIVMACAALTIVLAPTTFAAEFIHPTGDSGNVTLSNGESHKNVYLAGGNVFINSNIAGDLYAAAGNIIVEAPVDQDVVIAGGTITLNNTIGGDVRMLGGDVTINNAVGGDIVMVGGTLHLTEKSTVNGDLMAVGGEFNIDGHVTGQVKIDGGNVRLNSAIAGNVDITAESLTLDSKANVTNTLLYHGIKEPTRIEGSQVGTLDFQKMEQRRGGHPGRALAGLFTMVFVIKIIGLILAGILLMKLFPRTSSNAAESMQRGMWGNLGIGFLALIVGPIIFIMLLITFVGMYIAFLILFAWLIMLLVATLVACVFVGAWLIRTLTSKQTMTYDWQALVIGVVAIGVVMLVPFIGGVIFFVLMLMAFGGIIRQFYGSVKSEQHYHEPQVI
jgi:hypothetical protein